MSHVVRHFDYKEKCDRKQIQASLDHLASMDDWEEGCSGLAGDIRWIESGISDSYEEAEERIKSLDKGWYDCLAVRYYVSAPTKTSSALDNARDSVNKAQKAYNDLKTKINDSFNNRKSEFVGCKECGSKLSIKHLKGTNCPLCGHNLLSETDTERLMKAHDRIISAQRKLREEEVKQQKKANAQAKNREIRWLVKIEYHT